MGAKGQEIGLVKMGVGAILVSTTQGVVVEVRLKRERIEEEFLSVFQTGWKEKRGRGR